MDLGAPGSSGLLGSLRGFADGLLGSVQDRVELLSIELHEEKQRLVQTFVWTAAVLFFAMLAIVFVSVAVVLLAWNSPARLPVVAGLAGLYAVAAVICGLRVRRLAATTPRPFAATLEELKADRECVQPKS